MELVNLRLGGGGGASSDDCTALASQVLTGVTAVTKDSNDEPIQGTMPSQNQMTFANDCWWNASSGLGARMSPAYAAASSGSNPYVYVPPTNVRNTLGISADRILEDYTIAGVKGTAVNYYKNRTVFSNGTFDNVLASGVSQNWKTHRNKYGTTSHPLSGDQIYYTCPNSSSGANNWFNMCFDYTIDVTSFKSVTAVCRNYGTMYLKSNGSSSGAHHMTRGVGRLVLEDTSGNISKLTSYTAWTDTGITVITTDPKYSTDQKRTYTFDISGYSGEMGISLINGEEHNPSGSYENAYFRYDVVSFTFNV